MSKQTCRAVMTLIGFTWSWVGMAGNDA